MKWPLKQVRVCSRCDLVRWAPCSRGCVLPDDRDGWELNVQWSEPSLKGEIA